MDNSFFKSEDLKSARGYIYLGARNIFSPVTVDEISEAEKILGSPFPCQLKKFYKEIGYGDIIEPKDNKVESVSISNEIIPPIAAANFATGILFWEGQNNYMSEDAYEDLSPGDLPFFEIGDSCSFLLMKPHSENPNAVWYHQSKITDSFEEFVYRLYYESPIFYEQYM